MRPTGFIVAALLIAPASAFARDASLCTSLYRKLNNLPSEIGSTVDVRLHAREISQANAQIRLLRIEMRRSGCGGGSVITYGQGNYEECARIRQALDALERDRKERADERMAARTLVRSSEERLEILSAIRDNNCARGNNEASQDLAGRENGSFFKNSKEHGSSITTLKTTAPARPRPIAATPPPLPGPERPYDPNKRVRMVGPAFLPEERLDLAHPKSLGPQPQQ